MTERAGLASRARAAAAAMGFGAARDWVLDRYLVARLLERGTTRDEPSAGASALGRQDDTRFVGDGSQWVQPEDRVARAGDAAFGWGLLERWTASRVAWSRPSPVTFGGARTALFGHVFAPEWHDPAHGPHTLAEAQNLVIDFARLYPACTVRYRPRYRKGQGRPYHRYRRGALLGACSRTPAFELESITREHLRSMWGSFREWRGSPRPACQDVIEHPVLFVTREGEESRNLFHTTTDWLNAFDAVLVAAGVPGSPPIDRRGLEVVFLDNAGPSPFDAIWRDVFAPVRGVRRVADFGGRRVLFRRAIFSAPGYQSALLAWLTDDRPPRDRVGLFEAFRALVLRAEGIDPHRPRRDGPLRATLVARRPYETHRYMGRQLAHEAACRDALGSIAGVETRVVDFAQHPIEEQIRIAHDTDVLVGVHGAALTHQLWMSPRAGVVEIDHQAGGGWRLFRNLAAWMGREYRAVPAAEAPIDGGTLVTVDPGVLAAAVAELAARVVSREDC